MDSRVLGRCAVIGAGLALTLCTTAQGAVREVSAGPFLRADGRTLERALGDTNAYFVRRVTVHAGDRVRWRLNGFHTVTFAPRGAPRPPLFSPDTANPISGVVDAANAAFWFNGQPRIVLNPQAAFKQGGNTFRRGRLLNSGLPLAEGAPPPYVLRFPRAGTYGYVCLVHPGMRGSVRVVPRRRNIPTALAVRREARRQEKTLVQRVVRASNSGVQPAAGTVQAGNDTKRGVVVFKFFPADLTVAAGTTVTLQMSPRTSEVHTFSFGPTNGRDQYLDQIAQGFIAPIPGTTPPVLGVDPRAALPSDDPTAGLQDYTGTNHGNGFWNSGVLDRDRASAAIPGSATVRFTTPGTYSYICLIHPFMHGTVNVTP
jgi:plastocyanin